MKIFTSKRNFIPMLLLAIASQFATNQVFAQPTVTISPNTTQTITAGGTVSFTATRNSGSNWNGSGNYTYTWGSTGPASVGFTSNPNSTTGNTSTTVATFNTAGTYTVSCNVVRGTSNVTSAATTVIVNPPPAASLTLSPGAKQYLIQGGSVNYTATASNYAGSGTITYNWTAVGASIPSGNSATKTISFPSAGVYYVSVNATRSTTNLTSAPDTVTVYATPSANLWASSSNGTSISSFAVINGLYSAGPTNIFTPTYPGGTTGGTSTAAIGKNSGGFFYWLPNTSGNNGVVDVYGASSTGANPTLIGSLDLNGSGNTTSLGFVRLGMGPDGKGWILAGDGTTLFLASFMSNGVNPAPVVLEDASVTLSGGAAATFQNGDICVDGNGQIYALANNGSGTTQIFIGHPNGSSTTLTKKWDLVDPTNAAFTGSVNGVAFDPFGSLYITTAAGLYFIDQTTVNSVAIIPTVQCSLVVSQTGLQDLASNYFPSTSTLPISLSGFSGYLKNDITTLNWQSNYEINFSHFEIERSNDGINFSNIGFKVPVPGNGGSSAYQFMDDLSAVSGKVFYYRLKMIDIDGKFTYSSTILIRRDTKSLSTVSLSPNPIVNRTATALINSAVSGVINIRIIDLTGKIVSQQQNSVSIGVNSIALKNLDQIQTGFYLLQVINNGDVSAIKFAVAR